MPQTAVQPQNQDPVRGAEQFRRLVESTALIVGSGAGRGDARPIALAAAAYQPGSGEELGGVMVFFRRGTGALISVCTPDGAGGFNLGPLEAMKLDPSRKEARFTDAGGRVIAVSLENGSLSVNGVTMAGRIDGYPDPKALDMVSTFPRPFPELPKIDIKSIQAKFALYSPALHEISAALPGKIALEGKAPVPPAPAPAGFITESIEVREQRTGEVPLSTATISDGIVSLQESSRRSAAKSQELKRLAESATNLAKTPLFQRKTKSPDGEPLRFSAAYAMIRQISSVYPTDDFTLTPMDVGNSDNKQRYLQDLNRAAKRGAISGTSSPFFTVNESGTKIRLGGRTFSLEQGPHAIVWYTDSKTVDGVAEAVSKPAIIPLTLPPDFSLRRYLNEPPVASRVPDGGQEQNKAEERVTTALWGVKHTSYPKNTILKITNPENNNWVHVRVEGTLEKSKKTPHNQERMELSMGAWKDLGLTEGKNVPLQIEVMSLPEAPAKKVNARR